MNDLSISLEGRGTKGVGGTVHRSKLVETLESVSGDAVRDGIVAAASVNG